MPEVEEIAKKNAEKNGGSFTKTNDMAEAFKDADIVYPKSWAPFAAMEKRTNLDVYKRQVMKSIDMEFGTRFGDVRFTTLCDIFTICKLIYMIENKQQEMCIRDRS